MIRTMPLCAPGDSVEIAVVTWTMQTVSHGSTVAYSPAYPDTMLALIVESDPGPRLRTKMPCCRFPAAGEPEKVTTGGETSNCGVPTVVCKVTGMITPRERPCRSVS